MTTLRRRGLVVALVSVLTCSLVLGAAAPAAAAGGALTGGGTALSDGLGIGETVNDTLETVDVITRFPEESEDGPAENATGEPKAATSTPAPSPTPTATETTTERETTTVTETATDTATPESTAETTPNGNFGDASVGKTVGDTVATVTGAAIRDPALSDEEDTESTAASADGTTDDATSGSGNRVQQIADATTNTLNETANETGEAIDDTTSETVGPVDETVRTTTRDADGSNGTEGIATAGNATTENTTAADATAVAETTGELANVTGTGVSAVETTTGSVVDPSTGSATGTDDGSAGALLDDSVGAATEVVDVTVAETANGTRAVTTVVDGTVTSTTTLVDEESGPTGRLLVGVVGTVDQVSGELTTTIDGTVTTAQRTTDVLTDDVDRTATTTGVLVDGVVASTVGGGLHPSEDSSPEPGESYGGPTGGTAPAESASPSSTSTPADASADDGNESATGGPSDDGGNGSASENGSAATGGWPLAPFDQVDPAASGALLGSLLVAGSFLAARTGMAASATGAGATTLPQLLFAVLREFGLRLAALAGYSRYDFDDPLENENRAAILETVETAPGINLTSLVEETGIAESTARYHLQVLEHEGLLEAAKVRGRRRYVPTADADVELVAAFEEEATKEVLEALFEHEPATGTTLADALERDPSTVSHHLSRLSEAGLVDREQDGPALRNSLSPAVRSAFADVEVVSSVQRHAQADD